MKLLTVLASLIAAACAQNTAIGYPPDQTAVSPGQNMTVQINRPVRNVADSSMDIVLIDPS